MKEMSNIRENKLRMTINLTPGRNRVNRAEASPPQRAAQHHEHLGDRFLAVVRLNGKVRAGPQVILDLQQRDFPQRRGGGIHLLYDVQAVPIILDHLLKPANLSLDTAQTA